MSPVTYLVLSIIALASGPVLVWYSRRTAWARPFLDGLSFIAVGGLMLISALPDAFHEAGWLAIVAAAAGFFGPSIFERWIHRGATSAHAIALLLGVCGLTLHAWLDGAAISTGSAPLAVAVVLHNLPVGLVMCILLVPRRGFVVAVATLAFFALASVIGFAFNTLLPPAGTFGFGLFEGLVAGALLHVVLHNPSRDFSGIRHANWFSGFGGLVGVAVLFGVLGGHVHPDSELAALQTATAHIFLTLTAESAPALVFAYISAGLVDAFAPRGTTRWLNTGHPFSEALRGMIVGLPLPICSCGVIPLYRTLILRGVPLAAAFAFLVATPEIGLDAIFLSLPLLGTSLTIIRVCCAALTALIVGGVMGSVIRSPAPSAHADTPAEELLSGGERWKKAYRSGLVTMVDTTGPWIVVGLAVAAIGADTLDSTWLAQFRGWDVPLLALVGIPAYVCASGATPLATMLIGKGISPGAAIAFLLTGPATNVTTFGIIGRMHGAKVALWFAILVGTTTITLGYIVNAILPVADVFPLAAEHHHDIPLWRWVCVFLLGALFVASIIRQGSRGFVAHIFAMANEQAEKFHTHDHGDDHDHDHTHSSGNHCGSSADEESSKSSCCS